MNFQPPHYPQYMPGYYPQPQNPYQQQLQQQPQQVREVNQSNCYQQYSKPPQNQVEKAIKDAMDNQTKVLNTLLTRFKGQPAQQQNLRKNKEVEIEMQGLERETKLKKQLMQIQQKINMINDNLKNVGNKQAKNLTEQSYYLLLLIQLFFLVYKHSILNPKNAMALMNPFNPMNPLNFITPQEKPSIKMHPPPIQKIVKQYEIDEELNDDLLDYFEDNIGQDYDDKMREPAFQQPVYPQQYQQQYPQQYQQQQYPQQPGQPFQQQQPSMPYQQQKGQKPGQQKFGKRDAKRLTQEFDKGEERQGENFEDVIGDQFLGIAEF